MLNIKILGYIKYAIYVCDRFCNNGKVGALVLIEVNMKVNDANPMANTNTHILRMRTTD